MSELLATAALLDSSFGGLYVGQGGIPDPAMAAKPGAAPSWAEKLASGFDADAARADLAGYGWHNCANDQIEALPDVTEKFSGLFITHKYDCSANE